MLDAVRDAYHLLMEMGIPVRPEGDEKSLEPGILNTMVKIVIYWICRTHLGALCTSEHCRHAPQEMEDLDEAFMKVRAMKPEYPMPSFERLRSLMPSWEVIHQTYGK